MAQYALYPGCTLHSTGVEFGASTDAVCDTLGIKMLEIPDWNCCGASSAHSMDHSLFLALPARNLAQAQQVSIDDEQAQLDLAIPCAACFSRTAAADLALRNDPTFCTQMESALDFQFSGRVRPRNLLDILANDFSAHQLTAHLSKPLHDLKLVSYYGCLLVRPPEYTARWDDPEHPQSMDYILQLMGAQPMQWSYGVDCCGGSLTLNRADVVVHLVDILAQAAIEAGADALVTACPMCMANVDGRQKYRGELPIPRPPKPDYDPLPIFYFTELMALAYDLPMHKVLNRHLVDPKPLLKQRGIV
jgi:heterodisulfide reductase subunit B